MIGHRGIYKYLMIDRINRRPSLFIKMFVINKKTELTKGFFLRQFGYASANSAPATFRLLITQGLAFSGN